MPVARHLSTLAKRTKPRAAIGAFLLTVVSTQAVNAAAQSGQPLELHWQGPPNCPQQSEVTEQIRAILGATPGATFPSGLHAWGVIEPIDERFQLTLTVRVGTAERSRSIASDDCGSLGKAAAVVLSLLIRRANESGGELSDSDLGGAFEPSPALSEPIRRKRSSPPLPPPPADESPQRQWHLLVMAPMVSVDYLMLPKVGYGIGFAAGFANGDWRGLVAGTFWPVQTKARGGVEPYEAAFSRNSVEAWGCRGRRAGNLELAPCVLAGLDVLTASASGDRFATKARSIPIISTGAGVIGLWHMSRRFHFFLSTTGRIAVYRTDFVVEGMLGPVSAHTVPWGTLATSVGTELVF